MSQQIQPQQGAQIQQGGQQFRSQQMGMRLQDVQSPQEKAALDSILRAIEVCEWCADQCIQAADPNMVECIRLCQDVSEIGESLTVLVPRKSRYSQQVLTAFQQAVQACAQECGRHSESHCQECASVLSQTLSTIQPLFQTSGQRASTGQQYQRQHIASQ
jgi:hypothetical protein